MSKKLVIWAFWNSKEYSGAYYIPATHWRYINFASERYDEVDVILPCATVSVQPPEAEISFRNVNVIRIPLRGGYERYVLDLFLYVRLLLSYSRTTRLYIRVPDPMRWLPHLLGFRSITYHFVGNSIEVLKSDAKNNWINLIKALLFGFEQRLLFACIKGNKGSRIFANGAHLSEYLLSHGIDAKAVVSSTMLNSEKKAISEKVVKNLKLIHIGYIRKSKNLAVLLDLTEQLISRGISVSLDIVGDGPYKAELEAAAQSRRLAAHMTFHGHVDSRERLAEIVRASDMFVFPSLSEGSPRVVIEAMAFGAVVVSTRVGSLPSTFKDMDDIVFVEPTGVAFADKIARLYNDQDEFNKIRLSAYERVWRNFTLDAFLSEVLPN